jgi:hypothetical protein
MRTAEQTSAAAVSSNAPADSGRLTARRLAHARRVERHAKTARLTIMLSLLLACVATVFVIGGRAVLDPLQHEDVREANRTGAIVFTMPDGAFCRHLAFDNSTAEVIESTVAKCPEARPRFKAQESTSSEKGFAWSLR